MCIALQHSIQQHSTQHTFSRKHDSWGSDAKERDSRQKKAKHINNKFNRTSAGAVWINIVIFLLFIYILKVLVCYLPLCSSFARSLSLSLYLSIYLSPPFSFAFRFPMFGRAVFRIISQWCSVIAACCSPSLSVSVSLAVSISCVAEQRKKATNWKATN